MHRLGRREPPPAPLGRSPGRPRGNAAPQLPSALPRRHGHHPGKAIELLRLDRVRVLMETTLASTAEIARRAGFGSEERIRRAFIRSFAVPPLEWRARFGSPAPT
ncbi:helix-turn-helix domain-containing protein [Sabulicella rubraurantiaca]|uniref:helix-turn-helix domain-containing protein n=1 Tax=Sabulicella rubraurantiaca TaxID=2811429 RepID=UPI001A95E96A|nr:helix-turn-helix domain-containing protein [Sabulicella rubraurantiaca]